MGNPQPSSPVSFEIIKFQDGEKRGEGSETMWELVENDGLTTLILLKI